MPTLYTVVPSLTESAGWIRALVLVVWAYIGDRSALELFPRVTASS